MRNWSIIIGGSMVFILLFMATLGPILPFVDSELNEEQIRIHEDGTVEGVPFAPSKKNPLGTDDKGRDLLSLIVMGARETFLVIFIVAFVRYLFALPLAMITFQSKGVAYWLIYKWNGILSTLPTLIAAAVLINTPFIMVSEHRTILAILILSILEVGRVSYIFHQQMNNLSEQTFIEAGKSIGNRQFGIYKRYYIPYLLPQIVVNFVLDLGKVMLLIGQLGFLSIFISHSFVLYDIGIAGYANESLAWPQLLAESRNHIRQNYWIPFYSALAIAYSVFAFNLFGEGLRQHFEEGSTTKYNRKLERKFMKRLNNRSQKSDEKEQPITT
jgi:peptide/nickel transport system permease protein